MKEEGQDVTLKLSNAHRFALGKAAPWCECPHSPGLGHDFMSKHPGQEAFCLAAEEGPHRARGRRPAPSKSQAPGADMAVEASGSGPSPQCQPCGLLPARSQHQGPECVRGEGRLPSGYSLHKEHKPPALPLWLLRNPRAEAGWGEGGRPWVDPKVTA